MASTITFEAGSTTTVTNFTPSGTAGNLVTVDTSVFYPNFEYLVVAGGGGGGGGSASFYGGGGGAGGYLTATGLAITVARLLLFQLEPVDPAQPDQILKYSVPPLLVSLLLVEVPALPLPSD